MKATIKKILNLLKRLVLWAPRSYSSLNWYAHERKKKHEIFFDTESKDKSI